MSTKRRFLFLQGVCSPFFSRLALALHQDGHHVSKVNFTVGDSVYWHQGHATAFRGPMSGLDAFYTKQFQDKDVSDIVLFGDCRPVHRPAITLAQAAGIRVHVFEEGYFRPYWITLERNGVNGYSSLPRDSNWYREKAKNLPHFDNGESFHSPFWKRAAYDVYYNFWAGLNPLLHHGVRSHIPYTPIEEYLAYLKRSIRIRSREYCSKLHQAQLIAESKTNPYYLLPLQLATDSQIVFHSPFKTMLEALRHVLESFSRKSPKNTRLAVKIHPLDPGLVDYYSYLKKWSNELNISNRTFYLESGNLPSLLSNTKGVVTVNSTVGSSALIHSKPTIALGNAIYDISGLTFQEKLDNFWENGQPPDRNLLINFRDVVIHRTQINGGFYSTQAINLAIKNCKTKLTVGAD